MLNDDNKLIASLRPKLFKSRAATQKALAEKEKTQSECNNATLKLKYTQADWAMHKKCWMQWRKTGGSV